MVVGENSRWVEEQMMVVMVVGDGMLCLSALLACWSMDRAMSHVAG